ncbi:MAG: hypothetical protein PHT88_04585 [Candidatus Moranbacteria bacterium]|nr:hypothetical protein [Candidatus Moranbacteria bacterium]
MSDLYLQMQIEALRYKNDHIRGRLDAARGLPHTPQGIAYDLGYAAEYERSEQLSARAQAVEAWAEEGVF